MQINRVVGLAGLVSLLCACSAGRRSAEVSTSATGTAVPGGVAASPAAGSHSAGAAALGGGRGGAGVAGLSTAAAGVAGASIPATSGGATGLASAGSPAAHGGASGLAAAGMSSAGATALGGAGQAGMSVAGAAGAAAAGPGSAGGASTRHTTYSNPLNQAEGSDPFLVYFEGNYYLTATTWSSELSVRRSSTLEGLKTAQPVTVWKGDQPSRCCNMWAPELHLLDGPSGKRWYLYFTAGPSGSNTDNQRNHVLESAGTDPLGPYSYKARIYDQAADAWAIDASVLVLAGKLYFLFSAWEGDNQNVYIAPMQNPWTLSGPRVKLSTPTFDWERITANVNEGPVALQHADRTFVVYSASACWGPDYQLGMLTLTGTNPLDPKAWQKSTKPVFARADANACFGPGHNGFFKSPDGSEDWIVYHANASASGVCDTKRTTRVQKFSWRADGTPDFGVPVMNGTELPAPAGE